MRSFEGVGCPACGAYDEHEVVGRPSAECDAVADSLPDAVLQCGRCSAEFEAYNAVEPEVYYCRECRRFADHSTPVNAGDTGCPYCQRAEGLVVVEGGDGEVTTPLPTMPVAEAVDHSVLSATEAAMHAVADAAMRAEDSVERAEASGGMTAREERRARRAVEALRDVAEDVDERLAADDEVNL